MILLSYKEELSTSQKQVVIKLIEKKTDKRFIKNWRLISLQNTDLKLISKIDFKSISKVIERHITWSGETIVLFNHRLHSAYFAQTIINFPKMFFLLGSSFLPVQKKSFLNRNV